jgi:RNA polymerase sigma factor (TIGR02999 family)
MPRSPSCESNPRQLGEVTTLLQRSAGGERAAEEELMQVIYADLRRVAQRATLGRGVHHTNSATGIVHELYMKLLRENPQAWPNRRYFFAAFARAVHDSLVDRYRRKAARGTAVELSKEHPMPRPELDEWDLMSLRECLQRFEEAHPRAAEVFRNHYLLGLTIPEIADALAIGHATVERDLRFARTWLHEKLRP